MGRRARRRQAAGRGDRAQVPVTGRGERVADRAEPRAIDDGQHAAPVGQRGRIERDVAAERVLDQLILDDVGQRLAQLRPLQRRHGRGQQQHVARGDDQHRRVRARQQRERGAARALHLAGLVDERERQLGPLPFLQRHGRLARRQRNNQRAHKSSSPDWRRYSWSRMRTTRVECVVGSRYTSEVRSTSARSCWIRPCTMK
ncbi:hypothetical protein IST4113_02405 [Burkholderia cenocepacia]|nr:hypothetical protein IST4113_02405 [Burkholderia cenocepacia]CAB5136967.1 hypothetical protein IST4110_02502 [Burkholderia cenocepacia]